MISKNLTLRLIVAAVFIPALLYVFHIGGLAFFILVEALVVMSLWEFYTLTKVRLYFGQKVALILLAAVLPAQFQYFDIWHVWEFLLAAVFLTTLPFAFTRTLGDVGRSIGISFFGLVYLTLGFSTLLLIRRGSVVEAETAAGWITFLFAAIWIIDTAAYFVGANFGRHKLSPAISPNKTIEGFVGGFFGAILTAGIFNFIFLKQVGFMHLILPGLAIAFFGQLGDLVESIFKREIGVKDSSNLIPGHGGMLDRFDSLVFAAPALYLYLLYWQ
ncbi:MAG: phosphatidate cytidylyltransferase [Candidatus Zixiibacteriota bacterium]